MCFLWEVKPSFLRSPEFHKSRLPPRLCLPSWVGGKRWTEFLPIVVKTSANVSWACGVRDPVFSTFSCEFISSQSRCGGRCYERSHFTDEKTNSFSQDIITFHFLFSFECWLWVVCFLVWVVFVFWVCFVFLVLWIYIFWFVCLKKTFVFNFLNLGYFASTATWNDAFILNDAYRHYHHFRRRYWRASLCSQCPVLHTSFH